MGIVGFGGTGRAMARRAAAFGMICRAVDRDPVSASLKWRRSSSRWFPSLAGSDVVAVYVPLTRDARHVRRKCSP
jgi:lactate dehydrogenase-like 2-hydroxyacid dehydrogenase